MSKTQTTTYKYHCDAKGCPSVAQLVDNTALPDGWERFKIVNTRLGADNEIILCPAHVAAFLAVYLPNSEEYARDEDGAKTKTSR
jgi:hypothetical protein